MHSGNESDDGSAVYSRTARQLACDLRRRNLRGLAARLTQATRHRSAGVQSAKECSAESRKQERPHRCSKAGRSVAWWTSLVGLPWRERCTDLEGTVTQLSDGHQGSQPSYESTQGGVSKLGHSLCRQAGLRTPASGRVVAEITRGWRAPPSRATLPAIRCAAILTPERQAGTAGGKQEASRGWIATTDSLHRPDSSGTADRSDPDASSFPHQASTLGLQRSGPGDSNQCRIRFPGWATPAFQKTPGHP